MSQEQEKTPAWNKYKLHKLEGQVVAGQQKWSIVLGGPVAYILCDEETAQFVVDSMNLSKDLGPHLSPR